MVGIFEWLFGSRPRVPTEDRIWLTKRAKFAGVQRDIAQALADPEGPDAIFLIAHFEDCFDELRALVVSAGFDEGLVLVTFSSALEGRTAGMSVKESRRILVLVAERHPLPAHDDALSEFACQLPFPCRFVQHLSLEDPVLRLFSGEWVEMVLRQLGMNEDEPIESQMVVRQIRSAQQKIESRATGDSAAKSAEEWLEKNCPNV